MPESKAQSPKPKARRPRRLNRDYRPYAEQIARIFVECGENAAETAERVRAEIPVLSAISSTTLGRWSENAEWLAAVKGAKEDAAFDADFKPRVRGRKFLQWARETAKRLAGEHGEAILEWGGPDDEARKNAPAKIQSLENRVVKLNEAIRAEEKHQDELQDRAARRDMRTFARNFVELFATYLSDEGQRKLQDVQRDPGALMKGIE